MGRGGGRRGAARPPRLRTQTHDAGESDCSTWPGTLRETFPSYLSDFRLLYINSYAALIFRAAMDNECMAYNKHVLIFQYFIVEYQ